MDTPRNPQTPETMRTTWARAQADANVIAIRTGETIEALVRCLIAVASLSPYFDTLSHVRELAEDVAKRIRRDVAKARAEGFGEDFIFGARPGGTA